jgi:hypothetical protein
MGAFIYSRASENIADNVTPTLASGTADAAYPLTNLYDLNPAKPFKTSSSATAVRVTWDHGSAQRADLVCLPMHNIPAGTDVRYQMNATDSWGGPTVNAAITIPTAGADGLPIPAWKDLTGVSGYSAGGFRYHSLFVPALAGITALGEIYVGSQKRQDIKNYQWNYKKAERHPVILRKTAYGVPLSYRLGHREREMAFRVGPNASELALLLEWFRDAYGQKRPFLFVPDPDVNDAYVGYFGQDTVDPSTQYTNRHWLDLTICEWPSGPAL